MEENELFLLTTTIKIESYELKGKLLVIKSMSIEDEGGIGIKNHKKRFLWR
jgi:hypothetical protein